MSRISESYKQVDVVFDIDELSRSIIPTLYRKQDEISNKLALYLQECVSEKIDHLVDTIEILEKSMDSQHDCIQEYKEEIVLLEQQLNEVKSLRGSK
tara:strand:+ start:637 stop:927 length:291 start_codon:yes stop_codon:yes gene_type:complete